jgi:uncharacterized protein YecT (DUF1311 family)
MFAKKLPFLLFCLLTAVSIYPQNPSGTNTADPCPGTETQYEMNQCMSRHYQDADRRLNDLYKRIETLMERQLENARDNKDAAQAKYEEGGLKNLRAAARAWISYRDPQCEAARQRFEGGSMAPMIYSGCMWRATEHRVQELKDAYDEDLAQ